MLKSCGQYQRLTLCWHILKWCESLLYMQLLIHLSIILSQTKETHGLSPAAGHSPGARPCTAPPQWARSLPCTAPTDPHCPAVLESAEARPPVNNIISFNRPRNATLAGFLIGAPFNTPGRREHRRNVQCSPRAYACCLGRQITGFDTESLWRWWFWYLRQCVCVNAKQTRQGYWPTGDDTHQTRHAFVSRGLKRPHYNARIKLSNRSPNKTAVAGNVNHKCSAFSSLKAHLVGECQLSRWFLTLAHY